MLYIDIFIENLYYYMSKWYYTCDNDVYASKSLTYSLLTVICFFLSLLSIFGLFLSDFSFQKKIDFFFIFSHEKIEEFKF